ncbi:MULTISPECIES: lasso peptide biosynthesis B2 protein [unclassified Crossiella]|uniref:lasso peptide biosynthesis B2 protein n=1 Tax=unclassified Crossiella TaxID=2620835 RepID=UPI00200051A7|nr:MULTISPECIES: lasso peptide biosynthesis B2 protein [unclassified Crossiella]MCK2241833.1 lasso peptide biosynthesis B2 protein [Crossiella sp. S99.2]MCK2255736.1 lasso peptide biosynthesis B2 protein [Crossiella sp. S99.1]
MSVLGALHRDQFPPRTRAMRLRAQVAVLLARVLARLKPHHLQRVLARLSRGARPATFAQAMAARRVVLAGRISLHGVKACLPRSLSAVLLCRAYGVWPTWCVGVGARPPFGAHAWIEVGEKLVGEPGEHRDWVRLITVPPLSEPA